MKLGALQTAYLPWLGFFDQIFQCDLFVIYDDLQYTRKDWRNRNRIKTPQGSMWLTVPVCSRGAHRKKILEMEIAPGSDWARQHRRALESNYVSAPFFSRHASFFRQLYKRPWRHLAPLNREIISYLLNCLGIRTPVLYSSESGIEAEYLDSCQGKTNPTERIAYICRRFGAGHFLEGAAGKNYVQEEILRQAGVAIEYQRYPHPVYEQQFGPFIPYLSLVDLLFNHGSRSLDILTHGATEMACR